MTQKEAVKRLLDWLPEDAFFDNCDPYQARNVGELWNLVRIRYSSAMTNPYHFSKVSCCIDIHTARHSKIFLETPCICVKVNLRNRIIWFKEHLPYKGDCRNE